MATQFSKFWKTIYGKFSKHYNKLIFEFFYEIFPLKTIIYIILKLYKQIENVGTTDSSLKKSKSVYNLKKKNYEKVKRFFLLSFVQKIPI